MSTAAVCEHSTISTENSGSKFSFAQIGCRFLRRKFHGKLKSLQDGVVHLVDASGTMTFGKGDGPEATVHIHSPAFYRHAVLGGSLSVAESWLRGDWDCDDLTSLFRIFLRNLETTDRLNHGLSRLAGFFNRIYHHWHANSLSGSKRNIRAHYDLGNDFFKLMLDETMSYSSGIFLSPASTLKEASIEKMDRLCRKLDLNPDDHLLEIGTGWGGLAIHAAQRFGCRVTTTTISQQQHDVARQRIRDAGLQDRITLLLKDYRDLEGRFDKLVSVEMIEAVGHRYYDTYFGKCSELLAPDGSMVIQGIVMPDQRDERYLKSVDFIQKYVFPGGCLASMKRIQDSVARATDLRMVHVEDFGPHYARTLREWRSRFHAGLNEVRKLGYPDRFIRMWDYYLSYCEASFEERYTGVMQVQFDKPGNRRDPLKIAERATEGRTR